MFNEYVGINYCINNQNGVNCWGLVAMVYRDIFSDDLKLFHSENDSFRAISTAFTKAFTENKHGFKKVDDKADFDVVIMRSNRLTHCGIYYQGKILHSSRGAKQVIFQRFQDATRTFKDIEFWRK